MDILRACCGLNCEKCEARIATIKNDDELRRMVAEKWSKMNNEPSITPETINCMGCRPDNECKFYFCGHLCEIRKCCLGRGFETCASCAEWRSCQKLAPFLANEEVSAHLKTGGNENG